MKKYLYAGLLAATLSLPALAQSKFVPESPEHPIHLRAVIAGMALLIVLGLAKPRRVD